MDINVVVTYRTINVFVYPIAIVSLRMSAFLKAGRRENFTYAHFLINVVRNQKFQMFNVCTVAINTSGIDRNMHRCIAD